MNGADVPTRSRPADRRRQLLEAAYRTLVASGPRALRLKDIASEAEVTPAAILYHYPQIDDLIRDIYEESCERWYEYRRRRLDDVPGPLGGLRLLIETGMPSSPDDASVRLLCELEGLSVRDDDYARLMQDLFDKQATLYQEVIAGGAAAGVLRPAMEPLAIGQSLVAVEDSLSYYILNGHPALGYDECLRRLRATAAALCGVDAESLAG
jgi:AcrR family transcriptional regulator